MIAQDFEYEFKGHHYVLETWCLGATPYYVAPDGRKHEIPVHSSWCSPEDAMKLHALNMAGYCP